MRGSENQFQTELKFAHIDARACAGDLAEASGTRNRDACGSELVGVQTHAGVAPIRVVGGVERFKPELQISALGEGEILERREGVLEIQECSGAGWRTEDLRESYRTPLNMRSPA